MREMKRPPGRPPKAVYDSLKVAGTQEYTALVKACVQAIMNEKVTFNMRSHHLTKFPKDFPKGSVLDRDGDIDIRRLNARAVLDWLNEKGHSPITRESIKAAKLVLYHATKDLGL